MKPFVLVALLALFGGCHLHLWAGDHEVYLPPGDRPTPTPTAAPYPTPESSY